MDKAASDLERTCRVLVIELMECWVVFGNPDLPRQDRSKAERKNA